MTWAQTTLSRLAELLAGDTRPQSLAVLDVDGLAAINQAFGREVGDAVLDDAQGRLTRAFADALTERWAGDQFLIVLPFTSSAEAFERVCGAMHGSVGPMQYSLCAGGATSPAHGGTNLSLMGSAATALQRAKQLGAGRVVWSRVNTSND
jgi:diguanylate cyclase (GGDEF)-like protein